MNVKLCLYTCEFYRSHHECIKSNVPIDKPLCEYLPLMQHLMERHGPKVFRKALVCGHLEEGTVEPIQVKVQVWWKWAESRLVGEVLVEETVGADDDKVSPVGASEGQLVVNVTTVTVAVGGLWMRLAQGGSGTHQGDVGQGHDDVHVGESGCDPFRKKLVNKKLTANGVTHQVTNTSWFQLYQD